MTDAFSPIRGKCVWWREVPNTEDRYDPSVKPADERYDCSCFVEGFQWTFCCKELPAECPKARECRYFVKGY